MTVYGSGFHLDAASKPSCWFRETAVVPATTLDTERVVCLSPPGSIAAAPFSVALEVAINGQDNGFTNAATSHFTYHAALSLRSVHPHGGAVAGGTPVTIVGAGFQDLDTLQCLFGGAPPDIAQVAVAATLGEQVAGGAVVHCISPPLAQLSLMGEGTVCPDTGPVPIRVTNNGGNPAGASWTSEDANFTYYMIN